MKNCCSVSKEDTPDMSHIIFKVKRQKKKLFLLAAYMIFLVKQNIRRNEMKARNFFLQKDKYMYIWKIPFSTLVHLFLFYISIWKYIYFVMYDFFFIILSLLTLLYIISRYSAMWYYLWFKEVQYCIFYKSSILTKFSDVFLYFFFITFYF